MRGSKQAANKANTYHADNAGIHSPSLLINIVRKLISPNITNDFTLPANRDHGIKNISPDLRPRLDLSLTAFHHRSSGMILRNRNAHFAAIQRLWRIGDDGIDISMVIAGSNVWKSTRYFSVLSANTLFNAAILSCREAVA